MHRYWLGTLMLLMLAAQSAHAAPSVRVQRVPEGSIQPQVRTDADGVVHMVYFSGEPRGGDLFYIRRAPGDETFSQPIRVNSQASSAVAAGTVRGARMAAGRDGRVHVAWMGSQEAKPRGPGDKAPMLYTRLNDQGSAFEPQRNLMQHAEGIDGGGTVAADQAGNVYVIWHAHGSQPGDEHRTVYSAKSVDDGKTFGREVSVLPENLGACACCGIESIADDRGNVFIWYRAATGGTQRGSWLLTSVDGGSSFKADLLELWVLNACPMSTASLITRDGGIAAAWETEQRISHVTIMASDESRQPLRKAAGKKANQKHPALAVNSQGQTLLVWAEGSGWNRGGNIAWQVYDAAGEPIGEPGGAQNMPVWSRPAAWAEPDGSFVVSY